MVAFFAGNQAVPVCLSLISYKLKQIIKYLWRILQGQGRQISSGRDGSLVLEKGILTANKN